MKHLGLQTTNKIFNDDLFERLDPATVLSWQRIRAANWLAADGQQWAAHLDTLNSGTYNNQVGGAPSWGKGVWWGAGGWMGGR